MVPVDAAAVPKVAAQRVIVITQAFRSIPGATILAHPAIRAYKPNPRFDSGIRLRSCFVLPTAFPFGTDVLEADPGEDENTTRSRSNNRRKWLTF